MLKHSRLLLIFIFSISIASAQTAKQDLESSIDALNRAMISQDKAQLEKLTAEELSYGHSTGLVEDRTAFEKNILGGQVKFSSIEYTNQSIDFTGDIAIVRNISAIRGMNGGAPLDLKIGILMIWQKRGTWKLLARQGFKLP